MNSPQSQGPISNDGRSVVLFVDDEPAVLEGVRLTLRKEPYEIVTATSPIAALAILAQRNVDVVVSDETMPDGSGAAFLRKVRQAYPDIVRIVLTGEADLGRVAPLIQDGELYRFLTKPISPEELIRTLRQALQRKRVIRASRLAHVAAKG